MERKEFTQRVGIEPTIDEYKLIEEMYYTFDGDKDDFCKYFVEQGFLQNMCKQRVKKIDNLQDALNKAEEKLARQGEVLNKKIDELQKELDKELDWTPCEYGECGTHISQADYNNLCLHAEMLSE